MPDDYSIKATTKRRREKHVKETLALARLSGSEPSGMAKSLAWEYIDGKAELTDVRNCIIGHYKNDSGQI